MTSQDFVGSDDEEKEPMDAGGFDLQRIFDTAAKIKSAQLSKIRKKYESSPNFIKGTEVYAHRNNQYKDLSIEEKLEKCRKLKEEGNEEYKKKNYSLSTAKYSEAISIFRYFERKDERGEALELKDYILDDYNQNINFWKGNKENYEKARSLIISLMLNCCISSMALKQHSDVVWCCEAVLNYDPQNIKALYRMCRSYEMLDTTLDLEIALKHITKAKKIEPKNITVHTKYKEIRKKLREQNKKDKKTFYGLFDRGTIYDDKEVIVNNNNNNKRCTKQCYDTLISYCSIL